MDPHAPTRHAAQRCFRPLHSALLLTFALLPLGCTPALPASGSVQAGVEFCGVDGHGRKGQACVIQSAHADNTAVTFSVRNGYPFPVTFVFRPVLNNLSADAAFPLLRVCPGSSTTRVYGARRAHPALPCSWNNDWTWAMGASEARHDDTYLYAIPFPEDRLFPVTQGYLGAYSHHGEFAYSIDWEMPVGTPVLAAREGWVAFVQDAYSGRGADPSYKSRTNTITVIHVDGTLAEYSHIQTGSARVREGESVGRRQLLALSSDVGYAQSPHLHFRVFRRVRGTQPESIPVRFVERDGRAADPGHAGG